MKAIVPTMGLVLVSTFLMGNNSCDPPSPVEGSCKRLCAHVSECEFGGSTIATADAGAAQCEAACNESIKVRSAVCERQFAAYTDCLLRYSCSELRPTLPQEEEDCEAALGAVAEACLRSEDPCCAEDDWCGLSNDGRCECPDQSWDEDDCN